MIMRLHALALAAAVLSVPGLAQAQSEYSARFELADTPALRTGIAALDESRTTVGDWSTTNLRDAGVVTRDFVDVDATGGVQWSDAVQSAGIMHSSGGLPLGFGNGVANVGAYPLQTTGFAEVDSRSLSANLNLSQPLGQGTSFASWSRDFVLDPYATFTFSGYFTGSATGPSAAPLGELDPVFSLTADRSFASLTVQDAASRVGTLIGAQLTGSNVFSGSFSHTTGEDGLINLTVVNGSAEVLNGVVSARAWVNVVAAPVPEPATVATLLLGLGIVGAVARKAKKAA